MMKGLIYSFLFLFLLLTNCTEEPAKTVDRDQTIKLKSQLIVGLDENDNNQILGEPVSVRTDKNGNIFIADKASLTIKVFDKDGKYVKSIGRRGRGPAEFYNISMMELTRDNQLVILDRGNLKYTTITKDGEFVSSYPIQLSNQFYFKSLENFKGKRLGLYLSADAPTTPPPVYERKFFHVYSNDFQEKYYSFLSVNDLGINDMFAWNTISIYPGSFDLIEDKNTLLYSPGIYTGSIYKYKMIADQKWELLNKWKLTDPHSAPYYFYDSESEYLENLDYPGTNRIYFGPGPHYGRLNSIDAGIFYLPEKNCVVQFYAEWREGNVTLEEGNLLDLSVQIVDLEGVIKDQSYLLSMQLDKRPNYSLVNWMDENENFYLIDYSNSTPVVRRFALDLD